MLVENQQILGKNENSKPRRGVARTRPRPRRVDRTGNGEHGEEVTDREVHLRAFPGDNGSEVGLRKAEERSQHTKNILHEHFTSIAPKYLMCVRKCTWCIRDEGFPRCPHMVVVLLLLTDSGLRKRQIRYRTLYCLYLYRTIHRLQIRGGSYFIPVSGSSYVA